MKNKHISKAEKNRKSISELTIRNFRFSTAISKNGRCNIVSSPDFDISGKTAKKIEKLLGKIGISFLKKLHKSGKASSALEKLDWKYTFFTK